MFSVCIKSIICEKKNVEVSRTEFERYRAQNLRGVILRNSTKTTSGLIVFEQLEVFQPRCALYLK